MTSVPTSKRKSIDGLIFQPVTRGHRMLPGVGRRFRISSIGPRTVTSVALKRMCSMPSRQLSSSVLLCRRFVCQLMAASIDSLSQVRVLLWNVMCRAGEGDGVRLDVLMPFIVFFDVKFLKESSANNESASFH